MEELLPELPSLVPELGVAGLLVWLLVRIMRQSSQDRDAYRQAISELREHYTTEVREQADRHDARLAELERRHDAQIAELRRQYLEQLTDLRAEVTALRHELSELRTAHEAERQARWRAEDTAALYRRRQGSSPGGVEAADDR